MKFLSALILAATLAACSSRSSDDQQVRELLVAAEKAAEARDTGDVLHFVADDYADSNGYDRAQLRNFLRAWFLTHPSVKLLVNIESLTFPADGIAQAEISVTNLTLDSPEHVNLNVEFRRRGGGWQVVRADRRNR